MIQQKLHEQNTKLGEERSQGNKRSKYATKIKSSKPYMVQSVNKPSRQKKSVVRKRTDKNNLLQRSMTIKERIINSRERNLNLWEHGIG